VSWRPSRARGRRTAFVILVVTGLALTWVRPGDGGLAFTPLLLYSCGAFMNAKTPGEGAKHRPSPGVRTTAVSYPAAPTCVAFFSPEIFFSPSDFRTALVSIPIFMSIPRVAEMAPASSQVCSPFSTSWATR
jgi:hypothetical protein